MIGLAMVVSVASADIVYNDFNGTPLTDTIGMTAVSNNVLFTADLPGDAGFDVYRFYSGRNFFQLYRRNTGTVEFATSVYSSLYYVESLDAGQSWSDWGGGANPHGNVSSLNISTGDAFMLRADPRRHPDCDGRGSGTCQRIDDRIRWWSHRFGSPFLQTQLI